MTSSFWRRGFLAAAVGAALLAGAVFVYRNSTHVYQPEIGNIVYRAIALVDDHVFEYEGNICNFWTFTLGPLAHLLTAIPLCFSRDIHWLYRFNLALVFLSAPLFYAACRRLRLAAWPAALGAGAFLISSLSYTAPILPDNTSYLPFFLALYAYCLARALMRQNIFVILLWTTVGLCMQLNISTALLIPATLAAVRAKTPASSARHLAGLAIVAAMHFHLVYQAIDGLRVSEPFSPVAKDLDAAPLRSYLRMLGRWAGAFLEFRLPLFLLVLAVAAGGRRVLDSLRRSPIGSAVLGFYLSALMCMPAISLQKGSFYGRYNLSSLVFWAMLAALALDAAFAAGRRPWIKRAALLVALFGQIAYLPTLDIRRPGMRPEEKLEYELAIAERAAQIIREEDLTQTATTVEYTALCRYRHPEMGRRFRYEDGPTSWVWVCRGRRGERIAPNADAALAAGEQLADQFEISEAAVQIYVSREPPVAQHLDPCVASAKSGDLSRPSARRPVNRPAIAVDDTSSGLRP